MSKLMMLPALSLIETNSSPTCLGDNQVSHNQIFEMNTMMIYIIGVGLKMIPVSAWHDADDPWWDGYDGQSILMMMNEHGYRESTLSDEVNAMFDHFSNSLGR